MIRFTVLGSSSSANAVLVESADACILVDNGFTFKKLTETLTGINRSVEEIEAVLVTHEHSDHVNGVGILARKMKVPVFMTRGCALAAYPRTGEIPDLRHFESGDTLSFGSLSAISFSVTHDAADPVNYVFTSGNARLGLATDFGHCSQLARARLRDVHALIVESNYCPDMLRTGKYPPQLQQRIRSRMGHLSNLDMQALLRELCGGSLKLVVLSHISRDNNTPEIARSFAEEAVTGYDVAVHVAPPDRATPTFEVCP
ncbi:MAG TPA: MBL fold metallo-hydrolase [Candidatus Hydrogenedentes bacterium]|nr:MAG: putative metallo-hydrolase YycJ [Candidatus Hydrogenedentes bacterium ADurb.Bin170]HOR50394.1 MBL fold metallo-hydrolase [Candidatus Hydrogenedentota bacterium]HQB02347.1 MBL fold metallo-hydrolase [Candidatus Hydrogenedentota bacterium]